MIVVLVALMIGGYLIDRNLLAYHRQTATALLASSADDVEQALARVEEDLNEEARWLASQDELLAALSLINDFQDPDDYQAIVFDPEKQRIAQRLLATVQNGRSDAAYVFSQNGQLVSYAKPTENGDRRGILSFDQGKARVIVDSPLTSQSGSDAYPDAFSAWQPASLKGQRYHRIGGQLFFVSVRPLTQDGQQAGTLVLAYALTTEFLRNASVDGIKTRFTLPAGEENTGNGVSRFAQREASPLRRDENGFWRYAPLGSAATEFGVAFHYSADQYRTEQQVTRQGVLAALFLTALMVLPLSFWLVKRFVTQPLKELMDGVTKLSEETPQRLDVNMPRNELGQLAATINQMATTLAARERSLSRYAQEMERLNQVMAHHFQEPSRRLMLFSRQLQGACLENADERQALAFIHTQSARLSALVDGARRYLDLSRTPVQMVPVDLNAVIQASLSAPANVSQIKRYQANVQVADLPVVAADAARVENVFTILIDNALCYRHYLRLPLINIWSQKENKTCKVFIQDNGVGIASEHNEQAFSLFGRLVTDNERRPGIGLGLAIARLIMRQLEGEIGIDKSGPDGTTFVLIFHKDISDESSA
jgi:signal transduction histidine kinase